jgi:hypothetical protein
MNTSRRAVICLALISVVAVGCETDRSTTPTSPNPGGPIAGVEISAPRPYAPTAGANIGTGGAAMTLVVDNATTTGTRPLYYGFQISRDAAFTALAFAADGVVQNDTGRTSVTVSSGLEAGRTYHWRARAADGANTGPYSEVRQFAVQEAVVIAAPEPMDPVSGVRVTSRQPTLRTRNATRSGPAGPITYDFQVSTSAGFDVTLNLTQAEQSVNTQVPVTVVLDQDRTYHWRVRAREASVTGPWSSPQAFVTPLPSVTPPPAPTPQPPPPSPPPPPGEGFPSDAEGAAMVAFVIADLQARGISILGDCGAFEITKRVAWNFRHRGAGLERKTAGRRCEDASIDIILWTGGRSIDILIGGGEVNGPAWQVEHPYAGWEHYWIAPYDPDGGAEVLLSASQSRPTPGSRSVTPSRGARRPRRTGSGVPAGPRL